jgi:DNA-binding HxlR family transcriptional regulator
MALIQHKDGELSWYELDRAVSSEEFEREESLPDALKALESDGFINTAPNAKIPSQPKYSITVNGTQVLAALTTEADRQLLRKSRGY